MGPCADPSGRLGGGGTIRIRWGGPWGAGPRGAGEERSARHANGPDPSGAGVTDPSPVPWGGGRGRRRARTRAVLEHPGGGGVGMTPWCDDLVCSWRRLLADRHSLPFPWTLSLHRRWYASASHHPLTFRGGGGGKGRYVVVLQAPAEWYPPYPSQHPFRIVGSRIPQRLGHCVPAYGSSGIRTKHLYFRRHVHDS